MRIPFTNFFIAPSIIKFFIVGVSNTAIDFTVFIGLYYGIGTHLVVANVSSFCLALTNSYILNRKWSFSEEPQRRKARQQFILFTLTSMFTVFVSTSILVLGSNYLPPIVVKVGLIGLMPISNYLLYKYVVFS